MSRPKLHLVCVVDGCDRTDLQGHGLCQMHYCRWRRNGTPGEAAKRIREPGAACLVESCDRTDLKGHGWCILHYSRWLSQGDASYEPVVTVRATSCEVAGCDKPPRKTGRMCSMHAARVERHGDASVKLPTGQARGEANTRWTGDQASYNAVHLRVKVVRGRAPGHPCALCAGRQAQQWAYDHEDPDERASDVGPYSVVLDHYLPLCIPCHKRFDLGWIQERAA